MPVQTLKCRCRPGYTCSAPLHGTIEILSCEKNCGLGCDSGKVNPAKPKAHLRPGKVSKQD